MHIARLFIASYAAALASTAPAADLEASRIKCSESGTKFAMQFKKTYASQISIFGNPEFHYSKALSTCLVYTELIDGALDKSITAVWYYRRVTDVYSNKVLAYSRYFVSKNDSAKKETMVNLANVGDAVNLGSTEFASAKASMFNQ